MLLPTAERFSPMSFIGYNMVMLITDLIPSADMIIALEPDELGIRLLPFMARMARGDFQLTTLLQEVTGHPAAPVGSRLAMKHRAIALRPCSLSRTLPTFDCK